MHFFTIPMGDEAAQDELNVFLSSHRVLGVERHFVQGNESGTWAVCVTHLEGRSAPTVRRGKVDYREVLGEREFAVFAELRSLRKQLAESEGVPAYALFTNEQLARMVREPVLTKDALGALNGVGAARVAKYGDAFLEVMTRRKSELAARETEHAETAGDRSV